MNFFTNQGWECPKCGSVWSPSTSGCGNCNAVITTGPVTIRWTGAGVCECPIPRLNTGNFCETCGKYCPPSDPHTTTIAPNTTVRPASTTIRIGDIGNDPNKLYLDGASGH